VLIGLGIASLLGVATQHPALFLTFTTLLYWFGALLEMPTPVTGPRRVAPAVWMALVAIAVVAAAGQLMSAKGDLRVPLRALRWGFPYAYGFSAAEPDTQLGPVRWTTRRAVGVVRAEHAYFAITASTPHADATNPVQVRLWRGTERIADVESRSSEPLTWLVRVPDGQRFLMIETEVTPVASDGTGLKMSGRWLREIPPGMTPIVIP
jgi:hypothetical protein